MMKPLLIESSFPTMRNDMTIAVAQIERSGQMPPTEGLQPSVVLDMTMCYVLFLVKDMRNNAALQAIEYLVYADDNDTMPLLYSSWLWLARMTIMISDGQHTLALSSAENALTHLSEISGKKSEDFQAQLAAILYNLAHIHHSVGESSRAAKELTRSQKLYERLAKRNEPRFAAMLLYAVEASTDIIQSRTKQMNVLAHYQSTTELYTSMLENGDANEIRNAMISLVDSLKNEGDIMLQMGNGRNAVKYFTKALRYQKKLGEPMGHKDLLLSIGLAKALMRLINRRAAAEQLLTSLLPLAKRLQAHNEVIEIENLLLGKNKTNNIMTLLKGIF